MNAENHKIFLCTSCRHTGTSCRPGYRMLETLQNAVNLALPVVGNDFEISGTVCLSGCFRSCTAAFRASGNGTYLFGDIDPEADIDDLVSFAEQHRSLEDGTWSSRGRPGKLDRTAFACIPAATIMTKADEKAFS